jgi:hypothetical protein
VPVERLAATVVAHRRSRIGVACRLLNVTQVTAGVQGGGDEGVAQRVRSDSLHDLRPSSDTTHDPTSRVTVEPPSIGLDEDWAHPPVSDRQIDRSSDPGVSGMVASLLPWRSTVSVR